ncbi:structural maintenance of chromosomes protein 6B [Senna tora]|uniref:Structural maintenance of chromosomes protein 6B n=1 Tax=Senna tora TaxID=362788 RepID=A0A834X2J9_9FABA|nr:structural maintenance of chromosomes protein 6B [Senna tora]
MGDSRVPPPQAPYFHHPTAGIIKRIRLENFMCHSNLEIELGEWVNFITGQNGSGKSAILTALCVAFGCRAKGTQRATTLKDFIKTGCSNAVIHVEIKNDGEDAFKPEIYGSVITVERRISESTSSTVLKDYQGKKIVSRKAELQEMVEHFNIDVENPCVIMSQDKSREFLHSGNDKDKFKATLLQQVDDLLESVFKGLEHAVGLLGGLETTIRPIEKELNELKVKITNMEHVEQISLQIQQLKKKLAWSWVYDVDKQLEEQSSKIEKLKDRIPTCQAKIERLIEELGERLLKKKCHIKNMFEKTTEVKQKKQKLQQSISLATKEVLEKEQECKRITSGVEKMVRRIRTLEEQVLDIREKHVQNTQAEESEIEERLKGLQNEVDAADLALKSLREEEAILSDSVQKQSSEIRKIADEIEDHGRRYRDICHSIREIKQHQTNKVSAFGGDRVMNLLRIIERYNRRFKRPPIGPIGAHLSLVNGDKWAVAAEHAIGNKMLNSFIVTDHKDSLLLRECAREANYGHLQILIYDFSRPRLTIPSHMLPQTTHPSTLSVLHSENDTVINVLVDLGSVERQVLVRDYDAGKVVAFDQRISNLKEVFTSDGYKMFSRGSVQTVLPPNKRQRTSRLCSSFDNQINVLENDATREQEAASHLKRSKREAEEKLEDLDRKLRHVKRLCSNAGKDLSSKRIAFEDEKNQYAAANRSSPASSVDEIQQEISEVQQDIQRKKDLLKECQGRMHEATAKADDLKVSFEELCASAQEEISAFEKAESELMQIEKDMRSAEEEKAHYDGVMQNKVLPDIKEAEAHYLELKQQREEYNRKASIICCEDELQSLGGCEGSTPEQLSAQLERLTQRLKRESQRYSESIDDLRMLYEKKECKIMRKQQAYKAYREKLDACQRALDLRRNKFRRNATLLRRMLSWEFNNHLGKKGFSGHITVNYEEKTLSIKVQMPQDASGCTVQDTRGLSGGERSFSTLCFALALHNMTESPFRAMDEFDVFMDAVSRKISLDTLVDFAVEQGSQWIFITPHDIGMVKQGDRIKKQQMAAPRS